VSFSDQIRAVHREFTREKQRALDAASSYTRAALTWSRRPDSVTLVRLLRSRGYNEELKNGFDDVMSALRELGQVEGPYTVIDR